MRRLFLASMIIVLVVMQTRCPQIVVALAIATLCLKADRKGKFVLAIMLGLILLRLNLNIDVSKVKQGYVTEINASSFIVDNGIDHVLVYSEDVADIHPFDRVVIVGEVTPIEARKGDFGFDALRWAKANRIAGTVSEEGTLRFCRDSFPHFLLSGGFAKNNPSFVAAFRNLVYDTNPDDPLMDFISLGLQFSLLLLLLDRLSQRISNEKTAFVFQFAVLFLFSALFGFPLTSLRFMLFFLTSRFIKDRKLAFSLNILLFFIYEPHTLSQWTILIPLAFQFSSIFYKKRNAYFVRSALLAMIFLRSNAVFFPLSLLLFPILRKGMLVVSGVYWSATMLPFLAELALLLNRLFTQLLASLSLERFRMISTISDFFLVAIFILFILYSDKRILRILLLIVLILSPYAFYLNPFPQVVFLNAGQGDAILLRSAFSSCLVLIDTGPPREATNLIATLRSKGVDKLNALILTHGDADHSGNIDAFSKAFEIEKTIIDKQDFKCEGMTMKNLDKGVTFNDSNADSLIYATSLLQTRFLFMGDGDIRTEEELLERYDLTTDIVKLGHHGSQSASSDEFIGKIQARLALISVGKNSYGHPHPSVINRLKAFRLAYLTTRDKGDITMTLFPGFALVTSFDFGYMILPTGPRKLK
jgi:competence protein ComEC